MQHLTMGECYCPELSPATLSNVRRLHFFHFPLAHQVIRQHEGLLVFADGQPYPATAPEKWTEIM